MTLQAIGKINVDQNAGRVVLNLSNDFVRYYLWFIKKELWIDLQSPKHKSHITLANKKLHKNVDYRLAADLYHNQIVKFDYDEYAIRGGKTKGFVMFYLRVFSADLDRIKRKIGVVENDNYRGLHITLGNSKAGLKTYWPELIEIKK